MFYETIKSPLNSFLHEEKCIFCSNIQSGKTKPPIHANLSQSRSVTPDSHKPSACSWHSHVLRSCFRLSCFCSLAIRHRPAERDWLRFALIRGFSTSNMGAENTFFVLQKKDSKEVLWSHKTYIPLTRGIKNIKTSKKHARPLENHHPDAHKSDKKSLFSIQNP